MKDARLLNDFSCAGLLLVENEKNSVKSEGVDFGAFTLLYAKAIVVVEGHAIPPQ
jgi:hypothetical protein